MKISLFRPAPRQVILARTRFLLLCIFMLPLFGAPQLAAEQENELVQGRVSLTDLANFNSSILITSYNNGIYGYTYGFSVGEPNLYRYPSSYPYTYAYVQSTQCGDHFCDESLSIGNSRARYSCNSSTQTHSLYIMVNTCEAFPSW